jgi:ankyrin repeat protein
MVMGYRLRSTFAVFAVTAVLGLSWYAQSHVPRLPEPYLSSEMTDALQHRDLNAFAAKVDALASVDERDEDGLTPLLASVQLGDIEAVRYLLARGADPNLSWRGQNTPLTLVLTCGEVEIARELLRHGAVAGRMTASGDTPLLAAARAGNWDGVQLILDRRVELMPAGIRENPLNCFASDANDAENLVRLLATGIDPNRAGLNGELPLVCAAAYDCPAAVTTLLRGGADPAQADAKGRTVETVAAGRPNVIVALRAAKHPKDHDT